MCSTGKLKKVGARGPKESKKKPDAKNDLMAMIRNRAIVLKSVDENDKKRAPRLLPKKSHPTMIDHMRGMIDKIHRDTHGADEDEQDDDSDWDCSDDDWDD